MTTTFTITAEEEGQRLDVWCVSKMPELSRATLQKAIQAGAIKVNGKTVKPRRAVRTDDIVDFYLVAPEPEEKQPTELEVDILFEDDDVVVINKDAGVVAHPGVHTTATTISDWFASTYPAASKVGEGALRAGIVHRLDKDTSGVMILAKKQKAYEHLKLQFSKRRARKEYLALVFGSPTEPSGRIAKPLARSKRNPMRRTINLDGKEAISEWEKEQAYVDQRDKRTYALLRVKPYTGRTHQIRVHLHWLGFPIVGDSLYVFKRQKPPLGTTRQLLHAAKLTIELPNGERKSFTAPLPDDFMSVLQEMQMHDV